MDDYKKIAQERYQRKLKIIADKEIMERKILDEEQKKLDDDIRKKQAYIQSEIDIIDSSILTFEFDKTDNNLLLIITNVLASTENIILIIDHIQKEILINKIIFFTNKVDKLNTTRPKNINTIANVKILSTIFMKIFKLLDLNVEIITLDTADDELIARNLSKQPHLSGASFAAIARAKKSETRN